MVSSALSFRAHARTGFPARQRSRSMSLCGAFFTMAIVAMALVLVMELSSASDPEVFTGYRIVKEYSHDPQAFTQGLIYYGNDTLYESTGLYGRSSVREVDLQTGKVKLKQDMTMQDFGEGLTLWENRLLQVAWLTSKGYVYNRNNLKLQGTFQHPMTDGWGLTHDGTHIIGSDGTSILYFMNPTDFKEVRRVSVKFNGEAVKSLNELEYVKGEILANVWGTDCIARISPKDGKVLGWILLDGLRSSLIAAGNRVDVLNGIAWDSERDRLFVTGKLFPKIYEIALESKSDSEKINPRVCMNSFSI